MVTVVILEPLLNTTEATEYLQKNVNPVLLRGLTQLCKEKPVDPIVRVATIRAAQNNVWLMHLISIWPVHLVGHFILYWKVG